MSNHLEIVYWPIDKPILYARNPRKNDAVIDRMVASIKEFGFRLPILVQPDGTVVDGHLRLKAARHMGMTEIPVVLANDLTDAQIKAFRLLANRSVQWAEWDDELLKLELTDLKSLDFNLDLTGFDAPALADLQIDVDALTRTDEAEPGGDGDTEPQIDRAEELRVQWGVEYGQCWAMGDHRLLCGDSTKAEDVARLMMGEKARLVVTDPPYGVSYADKNAFLNAIDKGNRVQTEIQNDHLNKEQTQALWKSAFHEMANVMDKGAVVYCFMPQGGDQMMMMMMMMMMDVGIEPRHELIWLKNNHVLGRTDYAYKHEPILYAWKGGGHKFYGDFQTSILEYPRPQKADLHPTMKPVELVMKLIENSSQSGEILYEPFSGSGTTIIAGENLGRKVRAMEISPAYVAVALERYHQHTQKTPVKV